MKTIKVGTRRSKLALSQTQLVVDKLAALYPEVAFELVPYTTKGDRLSKASLQEIGGKGVFVKEIERALLDKEVDVAVHSLKDMPALLLEGCVIAAIPEREDVRDTLIFRKEGMTFEGLPKGAVIGTSSLRRQVQLQKQRPDLLFKPLRGNIDTRLEKLKAGEYDAIVLAQAGLNRMGWQGQDGLPMEVLSTDLCLPAIGQGALALECREEDSDLRALLSVVHDEKTAAGVAIERQVLRLMGADCSFPIAALASQQAEKAYKLEVMLANEAGVCHRLALTGQASESLAEEAVDLLLL